MAIALILPSCHLKQDWGEPTTELGAPDGSYSIHADLWMSGESKGWVTASELRSQKAAGSLTLEKLGGSNRHQTGWKTHYTLGWHLHTWTQRAQSQWAQFEENLSKAMARERGEHMSVWVAVCLDVNASVPVSLFGGWQQDTQVLFWSIKSMRAILGREANLSVLWEETFVGRRGQESDKLTGSGINGQ